jgi:hypothetical protein
MQNGREVRTEKDIVQKGREVRRIQFWRGASREG